MRHETTLAQLRSTRRANRSGSARGKRRKSAKVQSRRVHTDSRASDETALACRQSRRQAAKGVAWLLGGGGRQSNRAGAQWAAMQPCSG